MRWRLTSDGKFNVPSYYDALRGSIRVSFPVKVLVHYAPNNLVFVSTAAGGHLNRKKR